MPDVFHEAFTQDVIIWSKSLVQGFKSMVSFYSLMRDEVRDFKLFSDILLILSSWFFVQFVIFSCPVF